MSLKKIITASAVALGMAGVAHAAVVTLNFEGVGNLASVNNFYNGGTDSAGNSGVNYGISFSSSALGIIDRDAGGTGNLANMPSPDTGLFFNSASSAILNYAAGFTDGFSFFYSAINLGGSVTVWDGLNGTGTLLGTIVLPVLSNPCTGVQGQEFCIWSTGGLQFGSTARSVNFGGTANQIVFDNITFGSTTPGGGGGGTVPEPGSLALVGAALLGLAWSRRRG